MNKQIFTNLLSLLKKKALRFKSAHINCFLSQVIKTLWEIVLILILTKPKPKVFAACDNPISCHR